MVRCCHVTPMGPCLVRVRCRLTVCVASQSLTGTVKMTQDVAMCFHGLRFLLKLEDCMVGHVFFCVTSWVFERRKVFGLQWHNKGENDFITTLGGFEQLNDFMLQSGGFSLRVARPLRG